MADLNYAETYQQALAQKFVVGVKFAALYDPSGTSTNAYRYVNAKTIQIPRLDVTGMTDHDRDGLSTAARNYDNSWETKTLEHDRKWETLVDPADIDETNMAASIGNITAVFTNEHLFPEMDKYMASKLYDEVDSDSDVEINTDSSSSGSELLEVFDKLYENIQEAEVPDLENVKLYITPAKNTLLKQALDASRSLGRDNSNTEINRAVTVLDEVERIVVPSDRMKSLYDYTEGAEADSDAVQIHMILVHPKAVIAPVKVDSVFIDEPSAKTNGKYYYYQRMYWDVFGLERKLPAIQINAESTSA